MDMAEKKREDGVIIIKKYANRRLYNTDSSSYITLDHLSKMTREGVEFQVVDAKSGNDITHQILTQIIMDEEAAGGSQMLPVSFLRDLISMYGNSMQSMIPHYLEMSMQHFRENQMKMRKTFEESLGSNPLAKLAQQNMAMFTAATNAFMPGGAQHSGAPQGEDRPEGDASATSDEGKEAELETLRRQMAEMQNQLNKLIK